MKQDRDMSDRLQYRLYNYEVNPPEKVWGKIASSLDESHLSETFPSKLYNLEATPPSGVWEKIENSLYEEPQTAVPIRRKYSARFRYAAAAILIGLVAFVSFLIINNPNKYEIAINPSEEKDSVSDKPSENMIPTDDSVDESQEERDDAALEASKQTFARLDISPQRIIAMNPEFLTRPVEARRNINELSPEETYRDIYYSSINSAIHLDADKYNISDRYVMLMTPDGHIIRMAKKLGDLVCCVAGEDTNEECTDQLRKWRSKIASAPIAPSPGNFLDILDLVNSLKENNP